MSNNEQFNMRRFVLEKEIEEINRMEERGEWLGEHPWYKLDGVLGDRNAKYSFGARRDICKKILKNMRKEEERLRRNLQ